VIEEGAATGEFTAPTVLHCMHPGMSQAPVWCGGLKGQRLTAAIDELTDTLMMLVGELPARAAGR